jgi:hypothetical protein
MSQALIGLIGVIAGALLGGLVSLWVDRSKRRRAAVAAGLLVANELGDARGKVEIARTESERLAKERKAPTWWLGELPTRIWMLRATDLALGNLNQSILTKIGLQYTNIVSLNAQRSLQLTPDEKTLKEFADEVTAIDTVKTLLLGDIDRIGKPSPFAKFVCTALAVVAVIVLALVVLVPHVDVNSMTVASALEAPLGDSVFVRCNPDGDNWSCMAYPLPEARSSCGLTSLSGSPSVVLPRPFALLAASNTATCDHTGPPSRFEVSDDSKELVASMVLVGSAERGGNRRFILEPEPKTSWLKKAFGWGP